MPSGPFRRRGLALLVVAVAALAVGSASPAARSATSEKHLSIAGLARGLGHVRSRIVYSKVVRRLAAQPGAWGGVYTAKSGAQVTIYSSRYYPVDESVNQAAADFIGSLVHGSEISGVKIYFAPPAEVGILCYTQDADGCYFPDTGEIVTIGEDTQWSTVEQVVTHEYGHHLANNRVNDPWPAVVYGTKRWATYEGVCAKTAAGQAFPGDEGEHYFQNPGESFAESFMHLNMQKLGLSEPPWGYDAMFTPDAGALAAIEQDVVKPWKDDVVKRWKGRFSRRGQARTFTFNTPLDGVFATQLRGPHGSTLRLSGPPEIKRYSSTLSAGLVCGQRKVSVRFVAGGAGRFTAAVAIP
jgi:hypothetical protein